MTHSLYRRLPGLCALLAVFPAAWTACGEAAPATTVLAGCEQGYPPYCIVTGDNRADGFSVDLLRASLKMTGKEVSFKVGPWSDLKQDLTEGRIQALPLVGRTPEREADFDFTFPYLTMHGVIVVREGNTGIRTPADLSGKAVAVLKGDNAEEYMRRADLGAVIVPRPSFETALRELSEGRHDAVVIQKLLAYHLMRQAGITNLTTAGPPLNEFKQTFCFATRKGDSDLLAALNEGLSIVIANGTFRELSTKWFAAVEKAGRGKSRIVIGGDANCPPYEFLDQNGQPTGFNVDLTRAVARHMDLTVDVRLGVWHDIRQGLEAGKIDVVQSMFYSEEREQAYDFSPTHTVMQYVIVTRKGSPELSAMEELSGKTLLVMSGDIMEDLAKKQGYGQNLMAVSSQEEALRQLNAGHFDCALVAKIPAHYWIEKNGWRNLRVSNRSVLSAECCYAVQPQNRDLLAQFAEGLSALKETGEYRAIQSKWLSPYDAHRLGFRTLARFVLIVALPLLLILGGSFLWSYSLRRKVADRTRELAFNNAIIHAQWDVSIAGILIVDEKGQCLSFNQRFVQMWGLPPELLKQRSDTPVLRLLADKLLNPERFLERVNDLYRQNRETRREELELTDGRTIDRYTAPIFGADGHYYGRVCYFHEITEHKRSAKALEAAADEARRMLADAEHSRRALLSVVEDQKLTESKLRESEERFRSLYLAMSEGVALHRMLYGANGLAVDYVIESVNPAYERHLGLKAELVTGKKASEVYGTRQPPYLDIYAQVVATGQPCQFDATFEPMAKTLRISASSPGPGCFATVFEDITEQLRVTAQLQQSQRMESIGQLAGGIAHDFNNMLSVILGNAELAMDGILPGQPRYSDLAEIRKAAQRAADLTRQLLAFASRQTVAPKIINLNETLEGMISMLRRLLGSDIDLSWMPAADLWNVKIDPSQIDQILTNLCVNARDAIKDVGRLTIETGNMTLAEDYCRQHAETEPGDYVVLSVSDNGGGMSPATLKHVFEPFFTTKKLGVGGGTGLGLATVYGIVKQNRGFVNVYSELGCGTTFKIGLPRHTGEAGEAEQPSKGVGTTFYGKENVLLVEDDPSILTMTTIMLERLGYRVLSANSPLEALSLAKQYNGDFELLLTDIIMPDMNGLELSKRLKAVFPQVKCLFMSGYTANSIVHQGVLDEGVYFIQKPFSIQALSAKIRSVLSNV